MDRTYYIHTNIACNHEENQTRPEILKSCIVRKAEKDIPQTEDSRSSIEKWC
jgi:hypothetical protein